ncbi:MAG: flagellar hook capping FlgD N-terminal domain-containing protein [Myxococcales bacterium]
MDVSQLAGIGNSAYGTNAQGSSKMGKDEFMKLLIAQMSNQDPTAPADSSQFAAQLAQFSSVELLQSANSSLDSLIVAQAASNQTAVVSLVGKEVRFKGGSLAADGKGGEVKINADLASAADQVTVTIVKGSQTYTQTLGARPAGSQDLTVRAVDNDGKPLPEGTYEVRVSAATKDGGNVAVEQRASARVTGVSFAKGYPELLLSNGSKVKLAEVVEVLEAATASTSK